MKVSSDSFLAPVDQLNRESRQPVDRWLAANRNNSVKKTRSHGMLPNKPCSRHFEATFPSLVVVLVLFRPSDERNDHEHD